MRIQSRVTVALAVAIAAIACAAILFRLAPDVPPLTAAGDRLTLAGLVLLPFVIRRWRAPFPWRLALPAGLAYAVHFGAWVASLGMTSVAISVTAVTTSPVLLAGWSLVTRRDRPTRRTWAALALAIAGVAVLATDQPPLAVPHPDPLGGLALALLGAAAIAVYFLLARRAAALAQPDPLAFSGAAALVGGVALLAVSAALGDPLVPGDLRALAVVAGAALVPQLVGHVLLTWALRHVTPTTVALATVGEPAGATLLAALVLGEPLGPVGAAGCALTLSAVIVASVGPRADLQEAR